MSKSVRFGLCGRRTSGLVPNCSVIAHVARDFGHTVPLHNFGCEGVFLYHYPLYPLASRMECDSFMYVPLPEIFGSMDRVASTPSPEGLEKRDYF